NTYFYRMKIKMLAFLFVLSLLSCQQQKKTGTVEPVAKEDYFEPGKEYVHMIPDSLRTAEQQATYDRLIKELPRILGDHVVVEDSLLALKLTRDEFAKTGIPNQYYDLLLKDIQNINHFATTGKLGGQSLEEIWDNGKYYKELVKSSEERTK